MSSKPVTSRVFASTLPAAQIGFAIRTRRAAEQGIRIVFGWIKAVRHRREVMHLLALDDRMLKDIGLVRTDVTGVLAEPFGYDPSIALRLRCVEKRASRLGRQADPLKRPEHV